MGYFRRIKGNLIKYSFQTLKVYKDIKHSVNLHILTLRIIPYGLKCKSVSRCDERVIIGEEGVIILHS
jgi:hypothetical protein